MTLRKELLTFVLVGFSAALVHFFIVWILVDTGALLPLQANVVGFLGALNVSYFGHSRFTFNTATKSSFRTFFKFFSIAASSFVINQTAYYYGLEWLGAKFYLLILFVVLVMVAFLTYILSKFWAFAVHEPGS